MYSEELEEIIDAALADGVLTDKERKVLMRRAEEEGVDLDEFEVVIEGRLAKMKRAESENYQKPSDKKSASNKHGVLRKCPACGAKVKVGNVACEECGYEFVEVEAVSSAVSLSRKVEAAMKHHIEHGSKSSSSDTQGENIPEVVSVIKNFPIPNTAEDLIEFCLICEARGKKDNEYPIENAYYEKFKESVNKAKVFFPGDSRFDPLYEKFEKASKKWSTNKKIIIGYIVFMLFLVLLILIGEAFD